MKKAALRVSEGRPFGSRISEDLPSPRNLANPKDYRHDPNSPRLPRPGHLSAAVPARRAPPIPSPTDARSIRLLARHPARSARIRSPRPLAPPGKGGHPLKTPAFQWYPADYLADMRVRMLSWASRGLYVDLLCYCWREGWIPSDSSAIAQLTGCHDSATVEPCLALFEVDPSDPARLVSKRLNEEREKQAAHRKERSESGARGARKRWSGRGDAPATPQPPKASSSANGKPIAPDASSSVSSPSTSFPSQGKDERRELFPNGATDSPAIPKPDPFEDALAEIWDAYHPRGRARSSRKETAQELRRLKKADLPPPGSFRRSLEAWKASADWTDDGGEYVPAVHRWIAARKWEVDPADLEPAAPTKHGGLTDAERSRRLGGRAIPIDIGGRTHAGVLDTSVIDDSEPDFADP
jgi:hypothetical protein